jgi:hypothetical protein
MLRSFTINNPNFVNLIRENPRYTKISSQEILGKFVSGRMMAKEARYVDDIANGSLPQHYETQPISLKATANKEALSNKVTQIEVADVNKDKMALVIKRFKTILKVHKEYPNKNKSRGSVCALSVVSPVILLHNVLIMKMTRTNTRKERMKGRSFTRRRTRRTSAKN